MNEYATIYKIIKFNDKNYFLIPVEVRQGYGFENYFLSDKSDKSISILNSIENLNNDYVASDILKEDDLRKIYKDWENEMEFLLDFHEEIVKDYFILIEIKNNKLIKRKIKIDDLKNLKELELYKFHKDSEVLVLNNSIINRLSNVNDLNKLKCILEQYRTSLNAFKENYDRKEISEVVVQNGKIDEIIEQEPNYKKNISINTKKNISPVSQLNNEISLSGLINYINERVLGRENEVESIATTLLMNYTAEPNEETETILVLGPTGSGKTATFKAASKYLNIPFKIVDCPSLVPEGIKGLSLNDVLLHLLEMANNNKSIASKSIIVFDEFDKLSQKNPDFKESIINEFLKFIEGSTITIEKDNKFINVDTSGLSKNFLGVFNYINFENKPIGYIHQEENEIKNLKKLLSDGVNFNKEIIDRISNHIFIYQSLDKSLQKRIILESKDSIYLKKKERFKRQFNVSLEMMEEYINIVLDRNNKAEGNSMREINNYIMQSLEKAQFELLSHPNSYKKLIFTKETATNPKDFLIL